MNIYMMYIMMYIMMAVDYETIPPGCYAHKWALA